MAIHLDVISIRNLAFKRIETSISWSCRISWKYWWIVLGWTLQKQPIISLPFSQQTSAFCMMQRQRSRVIQPLSTSTWICHTGTQNLIPNASRIEAPKNTLHDQGGSNIQARRTVLMCMYIVGKAEYSQRIVSLQQLQKLPFRSSADS